MLACAASAAAAASTALAAASTADPSAAIAAASASSPTACTATAQGFSAATNASAFVIKVSESSVWDGPVGSVGIVVVTVISPLFQSKKTRIRSIEHLYPSPLDNRKCSTELNWNHLWQAIAQVQHAEL